MKMKTTSIRIDLVEVMPCRIQVVRMDKQKWTGVGVAEQAKYVVHPARLCIKRCCYLPLLCMIDRVVWG